jgi:hypothetical protein
MASTQGKIQLALRNTIDTKKNDPKAVMDVSLFSPDGAITKPVRTSPGKKSTGPPAAPPPYVIEVITGNRRENKSFPNSNQTVQH